MVILEAPDALAERRRITGLGVRAVWEIDAPDYVATHFHPSDLGGVLLSVDSVPGAAPGSAVWPPAGPDWRAAVRTEMCQGLAGVELQGDDPAAMAALWSRLLERPERHVGGVPRIELENAAIRFVAAADGRGPGLGGFDVRARNRQRIVQAAEARGRGEDQLEVCGARLNLV